jgi:pimeloyl-ACP methyl ester carboxylesterase
MDSLSVFSSPLRRIRADELQSDIQFLDTHLKRFAVNELDVPLLDLGIGNPVVFVPILEHLDFVYARQIRALSLHHRVLFYRRHESRARFVTMQERVEELRCILDAAALEQADFIAHGDAAMVLFTFALQYPQRCRSLTIIAQAADYRISPHPLIWLLHELFLRLPIERFLPASFLRNTVIRYITYSDPRKTPANTSLTVLPRALIEAQFRKIALWPAVYRYSVLPVIHSFDIRSQLASLIMPILLINRQDDALSPQKKTAWLARHLPNCFAYHVIPAGERFFLYSEARVVNPIIEDFLCKIE